MYVKKKYSIPYDLLEKSNSYFHNDFLQDITNDPSCTKLLFYMGKNKKENELIGYCIYRHIDKKLFLYILFVESKLRKCGYGKMILNYLEKVCKHIIVPTLNSAVNFYKSNGFSETLKYRYISKIIIEDGIVLEKKND